MVPFNISLYITILAPITKWNIFQTFTAIIPSQFSVSGNCKPAFEKKAQFLAAIIIVKVVPTDKQFRKKKSKQTMGQHCQSNNASVTKICWQGDLSQLHVRSLNLLILLRSNICICWKPPEFRVFSEIFSANFVSGCDNLLVPKWAFSTAYYTRFCRAHCMGHLNSVHAATNKRV